MGKFLACLFVFCKSAVIDDVDTIARPQRAQSEPLLSGCRSFVDQSVAKQVCDAQSRDTCKQLVSRTPSVSSVDSEFELLQAFAKTAYQQMEDDLISLIWQGYQYSLDQWKKDCLIKHHMVYKSITVQDYAEFLSYVNRSDRNNPEFLPEVGLLIWFSGHSIAQKTAFRVHQSKFPTVIPRATQPALVKYVLERVDKDNRDRFWERFSQNLKILPASSKSIADAFNGSLSANSTAPWTNTHCCSKKALLRALQDKPD